MHTDARTLQNGSVIEGDLAIIGAGAAGISLALEWIGAKQRVILLEGGGFDYEPNTQDLYRGENIGLPYYPLLAARLHLFGGTTNHWAGFCSPFDAIDFEKRDWVPNSGWPIARTDLDPFYARANTVLELGPPKWDAAYWQQREPTRPVLPLDPSIAYTKMWQFSPPTRMGTRYREAIVGAPNVHLYTHANVVEIVPNEGVGAVDTLRARTLEGTEFRVRATRFVLAASTIQNARLLLASRTRTPAGLGNAHDLVGRYFMEHLEMPSGILVATTERPPNADMYQMQFGRTKARGELALSAAAQRERRVLNATVSVEPGALDGEALSTFQWATPELLEWMRPRAPDEAKTPPKELRRPPQAKVSPDGRVFHLKTRQEQAPNPLSRVTLSAEKDAVGVPRARLDWRLTALDHRSFRGFYEALGRELGRAGIGRVQMRDWVMQPDDAPWPPSLSGGWHHMGTTRMSADPKQGVVDANCRVHGLANLYVAGASVYPTAGCANPTLTLVALTLRLSDHLKTTTPASARIGPS